MEDICHLRKRIAELWKLGCISLYFRASFWLHFKKPYSFVDHAMHIHEKNRLNDTVNANINISNVNTYIKKDFLRMHFIMLFDYDRLILILKIWQITNHLRQSSLKNQITFTLNGGKVKVF